MVRHIAAGRTLSPRLLVLVGLVVAALVAAVAANTSQAATPGGPDPRLMVLRLEDLSPGSSVARQRYFKDPDFGNAVSYEREFEGARLGGTELLSLSSIAEVGNSVGATRAVVRTVRTLFASKPGRALLKKELAGELAGEDGLISDFQFGRPRALGTGDEGFDVAMSFRVLGLRVEAHLAVLRVDRVAGLLTILGEPGKRVKFSGVRALAAKAVAHIREELAPRNLAAPAISGTPVDGQTLSATAGTWRGSPTSFAYQWQRCDTAGTSCTDIAGASGSTYLLTPAERGFTIRVTVTARNPHGSATTVSLPTTVVAAATGVPVNTTPPAVVGTPQQGQTLSATTGSWAGAPTAFAYQWQRCDSAGANCADVAGATGSTYALTAADIGFRVRVVVTATNAAGAGASASAPTATVT